MKYCLHCGKELQTISDGEYKCKGCKAALFDNPKPCAAAFIIDSENRVVMGTRSLDPKKGMLDCIGGFVDVGETYEHAMVREIDEETGIKPKDIRHMEYLVSATDKYPCTPASFDLTTAYFVVFLKPNTSISPKDDVEEIVIKHVDDLDPSEFAWDGTRDAFHLFKRYIAKAI